MHLAKPFFLLLTTTATTISFTVAAEQAQNPILAQASSLLSRVKSYLPASPFLPTTTTTTSSQTSTSSSYTNKLKSKLNNITPKPPTPLTLSNYSTFISPSTHSSSSSYESLIFITGGKRTCGTQCTHTQKIWNETAAILALDPTAPRLGYLDCDKEGVVCKIWGARPPTVWHFSKDEKTTATTTVEKKPDKESEKVTIRINYLNWENSTVSEILSLHTGKKYLDGEIYESYWHPINGELVQYGIEKPVGYIWYALSLLPSWTFMLVISLASRALLARRVGTTPQELAEQRRRQQQQGGGGGQGQAANQPRR